VSRLGLIAATVCAAGAVHGTDQPLQLVGTWVFQEGSANLTCTSPEDKMISVPTLGGIKVTVSPGGDSDFVFEMGCRCRLKLNLTPDGAEMAGPQQECDLYLNGELVTAFFDKLSLTSSPSSQEVTLAMSGGATVVGTWKCDPTKAGFSGSGTLKQGGPPPVACGDDDTAVGVIPYDAHGWPHCPVGAGMEETEIVMVDEITKPCIAAPGAAGEGYWALPNDMRERRLDCITSGVENATHLRFCRVDGRLFNPMTTSDTDASQYFAVLKLGESCPNGAIEISKVIDNEDERTGGDGSVIYGRAGPNTTSVDPGSTNTTLHFCYFRRGDAPATALPDLGFRYGVFHKYKGEQPPWVLAKSWAYSNDEDFGAQSMYLPSPATSPHTREFEDVIESIGGDTYFDIAWVR
jgi:hypothetical protein